MTDPPGGMPDESEDELEARLRAIIGRDPLADETEPDPDPFAEVKDTLDEAGSGGLTALDKVESDFDERLKHLENRAQGVRSEREEKHTETKRQESLRGEEARGLGIGMSVAYTILGLPMVGIAIGWFFDRGATMRYWTGVGALVGATLGVVMAIYMLNKYNNR